MENDVEVIQEIISELMAAADIDQEQAAYIVRKSGVLNSTNWGAWITDVIRIVWAMRERREDDRK